MSTSSPLNISAEMSAAIRGGQIGRQALLIREHPDQLHFKTPLGGQTWLGYAVRLASIETVKNLLSIGFDVNEGDPVENVKPICDAAYKDRLDVARLLLDAGAMMDTATSVQNPLFAAIVGRSPAVVRLLLERGMDATVRYNSKTMKNMDAVAFAWMQGERECARIIALWNAKGEEVEAQKALREAEAIARDNAFGSKGA